MKFTNLGGATGILEHKGKRILFDPWLDEGIFHGAWHHYPPVNLPENSIKALGRFDYIYISHIHEDHCSLETLKQLNTDAEVIIMERTPNFVLQFIQRNNLNFKKVHLIPPWKKVSITEDLEVAMVTADPAHELNFMIDSGLILNWDGFVIYNSNDCAPFSGSLDFIKNNYSHVDLGLLPYATGSSYPSCFTNLSSEQKFSEKERLFNFGMKKFNEAAKATKAKIVMPFADQYVIVGSKYELNKYMPHPASPGIVRDHFQDTPEQKLLLLNSGQSYELENGVYSPKESFYFHSEQEKMQYAHEHKNNKYDYEQFPFSKSINLTNLMNFAGLNYFKKLKAQKIHSETAFIIEVTDWNKKYIVNNFKHEIVEVDFTSADVEPYLKVQVEAGLLILLLIGQISWNIADAALFIDYTRKPNVYDPKIHSLWNYLKI